MNSSFILCCIKHDLSCALLLSGDVIPREKPSKIISFHGNVTIVDEILPLALHIWFLDALKLPGHDCASTNIPEVKKVSMWPRAL